MDQFKNAHASHEHSLEILDLVYLYDDFMDSLGTVADMGCGHGLDINWWATAMTRDENPEPHNYVCYAVDRDIKKLSHDVAALPNVHPIQGDFEERILPREVDFLWCHDAFQYATNPLQTLKVWNESMNVNGMAVITIPQHQGYNFNRMVVRSMNGCYFNHNAVSMMYMLAVNGFDCKDAFFLKKDNNPWLSIAVYKSDIAPMDPKTTTWYELVEKNLVNDSVIESVNKYGHVRQEDLLFTWLDRDFHYIKD
jgi:trans-aconitate methyltransferase